jgi:hypothetical protein|nr:MAG TPA_asm: hypothetical protein [Caudoviricetes sp.]
MDKNMVDQLMEAIGAYCEVSAIMRDMLIKSGYTRQEAVDISGKYLVSVLLKATDGGKNNGN